MMHQQGLQHTLVVIAATGTEPITPDCSCSHAATRHHARAHKRGEAHRAGAALHALTLMASQLARVAVLSFCSRVRPCTPSTYTPAACSMRAYASVRSSSGKIRILAVTGTLRPATTPRT